MSKNRGKIEKDVLKFNGTVTEAFPNAMFKVTVQMGNDSKDILATLCGKMKVNFIKVLTGDNVTLEVSPYDPTRGRILSRVRV